MVSDVRRCWMIVSPFVSSNKVRFSFGPSFFTHPISTPIIMSRFVVAGEDYPQLEPTPVATAPAATYSHGATGDATAVAAQPMQEATTEGNSLEEQFSMFCRVFNEHMQPAARMAILPWHRPRAEMPTTVADLKIQPFPRLADMPPPPAPTNRLAVRLDGLDFKHDMATMHKLVSDLFTALERSRATGMVYSVRFQKKPGGGVGSNNVLSAMLVDFSDARAADAAGRELHSARYNVAFAAAGSLLMQPCTTCCVLDLKGNLHGGDEDGGGGVTKQDVAVLLADGGAIVPGFEAGIFYVALRNANAMYAIFKTPSFSADFQRHLFRRFGLLLIGVDCDEAATNRSSVQISAMTPGMPPPAPQHPSAGGAMIQEDGRGGVVSGSEGEGHVTSSVVDEFLTAHNDHHFSSDDEDEGRTASALMAAAAAGGSVDGDDSGVVSAALPDDIARFLRGGDINGPLSGGSGGLSSSALLMGPSAAGGLFGNDPSGGGVLPLPFASTHRASSSHAAAGAPISLLPFGAAPGGGSSMLSGAPSHHHSYGGGLLPTHHRGGGGGTEYVFDDKLMVQLEKADSVSDLLHLLRRKQLELENASDGMKERLALRLLGHDGSFLLHVARETVGVQTIMKLLSSVTLTDAIRSKMMRFLQEDRLTQCLEAMVAKRPLETSFVLQMLLDAARTAAAGRGVLRDIIESADPVVLTLACRVLRAAQREHLPCVMDRVTASLPHFVAAGEKGAKLLLALSETPALDLAFLTAKLLEPANDASFHTFALRFFGRNPDVDTRAFLDVASRCGGTSSSEAAGAAEPETFLVEAAARLHPACLEFVAQQVALRHPKVALLVRERARSGATRQVPPRGNGAETAAGSDYAAPTTLGAAPPSVPVIGFRTLPPPPAASSSLLVAAVARGGGSSSSTAAKPSSSHAAGHAGREVVAVPTTTSGPVPFPPLPPGSSYKISISRLKYFFMGRDAKTTYKHPATHLEYPATLQAAFRQEIVSVREFSSRHPQFSERELKHWLGRDAVGQSNAEGSDAPPRSNDPAAGDAIAAAVRAELEQPAAPPPAAYPASSVDSRKRPRGSEAASNVGSVAAAAGGIAVGAGGGDGSNPRGFAAQVADWAAGMDQYPEKGPPFPSVDATHAVALSASHGSYYFREKLPASKGAATASYKHPITRREYRATPQAFFLDNKVDLEDYCRRYDFPFGKVKKWLADQRIRDKILDNRLLTHLKVTYRAARSGGTGVEGDAAAVASGAGDTAGGVVSPSAAGTVDGTGESSRTADDVPL